MDSSSDSPASGALAHGVALCVAYDGTAFAGWQRQSSARSVQGEIERWAAEITGHAITLRAAGRTDAGVHAEGQIAAFATHCLRPPAIWARALNAKLPDDVAIRRVWPCAPRYDPRFDALGKTYRYVLQVGPNRNPFSRAFAWRAALRGSQYRSLDLEAIERGAAELIGQHDFRAFRSSNDTRENTVRELREIRVVRRFRGAEDLVALEFRGNAFMHNMVRILVGTLVEVGAGQRPVESLRALLSPEATRERAGMTAPAHGLTLVEVELGRIAATRAADRGC